MTSLPLPIYRQEGWQAPLEDAPPFLLLTLAFTTFFFLVEFYLDTRQLRRFSRNEGIPEELRAHVTPETFEKSLAYRRDQFSLRMCESVFSFSLGAALLLCGYLPLLWDAAAACTQHTYTGLFTPSSSASPLLREALTSWVFVALMTLCDALFSLPFSLYSTFVVEQRHGFNKSTLALFAQDKLLTLGITLGITAPILPVVVWLVRAGGERFYFFVWLFLCATSVVLATVYPTLIAPLFNQYTDIEDGETKAAIEKLAKEVDFPLTHIFCVDGSRRSAHANAYFYGFFKNKRIVLYDTLLKQVSLEELLAVLGHELGHWKLGHTIQGFVVSQLYTFCLFLAFSYTQSAPSLFTAFGFAHSAAAASEGVPVVVGLMLFTQTFWGVVDKLLSLALTVNSRRNEFAADAFAASLGRSESLCAALVKLSVQNLDNLVPDVLYSAYHYSHPPLVERLRALHMLGVRGEDGSDRDRKDNKDNKDKKKAE